MAIKQLSVFVENRAGSLVKITDLLANSGIDIRAMSIADTKDFGILRLIVSDVEMAKNSLKENNCIVSITEVVAVAVSDEPGSLTNVIKLLSDNGINIEYMYAFITVSKKYAYVVLRVQDNAKAEELLLENKIAIVSESDIMSL